MFSVTLRFYFLCVGCCSRSRGAVSLQEDWKLVLASFSCVVLWVWPKWETINLSCSDLVVAHWYMFFFHYREHTNTFSLIDYRNNITAKEIKYLCDESYVDNMILLQRHLLSQICGSIGCTDPLWMWEKLKKALASGVDQQSVSRKYFLLLTVFIKCYIFTLLCNKWDDLLLKRIITASCLFDIFKTRLH